MSVDGVLQLDDTEKELVHESFVVDTRDHEDHTFCGVMFNVLCETHLPAEYIEVSSVWVRGQLGPMTVWHTPDSFAGKQECQEEWEKIYEKEHPPNNREYTELCLDKPIRLKPGERCGLYIHSALPGDEALVYDNQRNQVMQPNGTCHGADPLCALITMSAVTLITISQRVPPPLSSLHLLLARVLSTPPPNMRR